MPPALIFLTQLILGYLPWLLVFRASFWPRLKTMSPLDAQRAIAMLHAFRFFGLAFLIPGVVGPALPAGFASFAAYGDFAVGILAMLALLAARRRPLFWLLIGAFNLLGAADILIDYVHGIEVGLAPLAGQLGSLYVIPMVYVPLLMITHGAALYLALRPSTRAALAAS
jgi:hypothetical protein